MLGTCAPPIVLVVGALVLLVLDRLFPGHTLGYGFPRFLEMVHLEGARVKQALDDREDARRGDRARRRRLGRP